MHRPLSLLLGAALLLAAGCSTPAICQDACRAWDRECGYSDYDQEACEDDCARDGDWTRGYADCVQAADGCFEVEACDPDDVL